MAISVQNRMKSKLILLHRMLHLHSKQYLHKISNCRQLINFNKHATFVCLLICYRLNIIMVWLCLTLTSISTYGINLETIPRDVWSSRCEICNPSRVVIAHMSHWRRESITNLSIRWSVPSLLAVLPRTHRGNSGSCCDQQGAGVAYPHDTDMACGHLATIQLYCVTERTSIANSSLSDAEVVQVQTAYQ